MKSRWIIWVAQGFGAGRLRPAPGTWGSAVGLLWLACLLLPQHTGFFLAAAPTATAASIWCCGRAEQLLGQHDPPSVVLDEIVAVPWCYVASLHHLAASGTGLVGPERLLAATELPWTAATWVLFRLYDALKPPPICWSQRLPGGWGITVDDLLAAGLVNLTILAARAVVH